jgi:hypothetical protein
VDRRDFVAPVEDDGRKVERLRSGDELRARFAVIEVGDDELRSAAETAWLYGDGPKKKRVRFTRSSARIQRAILRRQLGVTPHVHYTVGCLLPHIVQPGAFRCTTRCENIGEGPAVW